MFSTINSLGVSGIGGYLVSVEVYITNGLPHFEVVGLPDAAVKEARERVHAAVKNSGFRFPVSRLTVNLAPADKKKTGTVYDLPILVGILAASGDIAQPDADTAFIGELGLSGELRPVQGTLPMGPWRWLPNARGSKSSLSRPRTPPRPPSPTGSRSMGWRTSPGLYVICAAKRSLHPYPPRHSRRTQKNFWTLRT